MFIAFPSEGMHVVIKCVPGRFTTRISLVHASALVGWSCFREYMGFAQRGLSAPLVTRSAQDRRVLNYC